MTSPLRGKRKMQNCGMSIGVLKNPCDFWGSRENPSLQGAQIQKNKKALRDRVISLAENSKIPLSASIAFVQTNPEWAKPQPLLQAERAHTQDEKSCMYALFLLVKFLLPQK